MKTYLASFFVVFCCVFHGTDGRCEHEGKIYKPRERYYTADCKQRCRCRRRGTFKCVPLCKTTIPKCVDTFIKTVRVNNTNCTCSVIKCTKNPRNRTKKPTMTTTIGKTSVATGSDRTNQKDSTNNDSTLLGWQNIIIIGVLVFILVVITTICLCRWWITGAFCCKEKSNDEEGQHRTWSNVLKNRPLPTPPAGKNNHQQKPPIDSIPKTEPPNKIPPRVRGVPNPYHKDLTAGLKKQQDINNLNADTVSTKPHHSNYPYYQELEQTNGTSSPACDAHEECAVIYTDLTDIREDFIHSLPNSLQNILVDNNDEDYLQPLPFV